MYEIKMRENEFDEYRTVLEIYYNGKLLNEYYDGGEPEDNLFCRDCNWISTELKRAYRLGREDGANKTDTLVILPKDA